MSESKSLAELGLSSRRTLLMGGLGAAAVLALPGAAAHATAGATQSAPGKAFGPTAVRIKDLTGPHLTTRFDAELTDLGIPVVCPNGTMLFVCGDTFKGPAMGQQPWTAPVGLRSTSTNLNNLAIDGCVGGDRVRNMVPESHTEVDPGRFTTAIPSDAFTVGDTMYMHLMRGVIYDTSHTELWSSKDNGETWTKLCEWARDLHRSNFQQKTYAIANDGYAYVLSGLFNRGPVSELLLHRVRQDRLGEPAAYEPWGWNGQWGWGIPPTSIARTRKWGEICFRAMDGKYAFTYFDESALQIKLQVLATPTSNVTTTPEQVLIQHGGVDQGNILRNPYGGWVIPGSTFNNFHCAISRWIYPSADYKVIQYRFDGVVA